MKKNLMPRSLRAGVEQRSDNSRERGYHRYINFKFTEAGGVWQKTGKSAKFGQKIGIFTHF